MKIAVKNLQNEVVREIDLDTDVFDYPYKEHLIHAAIRAHLAKQRRGTHKVKVRSEVAGSGRKLWRQKGTGRARVGSIRSPLWRKGGTVHGPQPRSYELKLSVREKKNALKSALSQKHIADKITVVDSLDLESHKTGALAKQLNGLGIVRKTLLVDSCTNENLQLASRNHPELKAVDALALNVYDVVDREQVLFSEAGLNTLMEVLKR